MRKKITAAFLAIVLVLTILPLTAQALPNLTILKVDKSRNSSHNYTFTYQLRNSGPDDLVLETFWDAAGFKEGGVWITAPNSLILHENYSLDSGSNSEEFSWTGDTPHGLTWFVQCTDEYNDVDETDDSDNCLLKLWYFR